MGNIRQILEVTGFYLILSVGCLLWVYFSETPVQEWIAPDAVFEWYWDGLIGLGVGLAVVGLGHVANAKIAAARRLSDEIRKLLPPLTGSGVVLVALTSGVAEELLFRGMLQPTIGFWPTVALFAIVHGFFIRRFWAWMIFAGLAGLLFGWLVLVMGTLLAPTVAHCTINGLNLLWLLKTRDEVSA